MLFDDPFEHRRVARMVPDVVGPDDRDRPGLADPEAVGLGSLHPAALRKPALGQAALEEVPRLEPALLRAALRLGLVAAQENVPAGGETAEVVEDLRRQRDLFGRIVQRERPSCACRRSA